MCASEHKTCPRCHAPFVCRAGAIHACQCSTVNLTDAERIFIAGQYSGCLCANCLSALKNLYGKQAAYTKKTVD